LGILLTSTVPWSNIAFAIVMTEVSVVTRLIAALVSSSYKWGFWTISLFAYFFTAWVVLVSANQNTSVLGTDVSRHYQSMAFYIMSLWFLYFINFGLAEGGNVISVDSEFIFYGILDLLTAVAFSALLIFGHRKIDPSRLNLATQSERFATNGSNKERPNAANGPGGLIANNSSNAV
jgi:bacteriorhodopsin